MIKQSVYIAFAFSLFLPFLASAQTPTHDHATDPATQPARARGDESMMTRCKEMMSKRSAMAEDMKSMEAALDRLVVTMNSARGDRRLEAVIAVINEMTSQRRSMHDRMMSMQTMMTTHMMEHMQKGSMESLSSCPMMKGLAARAGEDQKGAQKGEEHSGHHP